MLLGIWLAVACVAVSDASTTRDRNATSTGTTEKVIVAKCRFCTCGGPHAHPDVTDIVVVPQCFVDCEKQIRLALYCETFDMDPLLNGFLGPPPKRV